MRKIHIQHNSLNSRLKVHPCNKKLLPTIYLSITRIGLFSSKNMEDTLKLQKKKI